MPPYPYRCPMFAKAYENNMEIWRKDHLKPCSRCGHTPYFRYVEYKKRFFKKGRFEAYCNNKKCPMFGITIASADVREDLEYALNNGKPYYTGRPHYEVSEEDE